MAGKHRSANVKEGEPDTEGKHSRRPASFREVKAEVTAKLRKKSTEK